MAAPVRRVTIRGLSLRDTRYTYLDPHGMPSGGDWALQRSGAIVLEGTEGVEVSGCELTNIDGNGVSINGCGRHLTTSSTPPPSPPRPRPPTTAPRADAPGTTGAS